MAAKRIKSEINIEPIASWEEADEKLKRIGDIVLEINQHEKTAKDKIDAATAVLVKATTPLEKEKTRLIESLEAYATNHIDDFGKAQSKELNYGKMGWRKSSAISISKKFTLALIKKIFDKRAAQYLNIKESVNKETLKLLTDQELASVKARRENKEVFFVEPDLPIAVDYNADKKS